MRTLLTNRYQIKYLDNNLSLLYFLYISSIVTNIKHDFSASL